MLEDQLVAKLKADSGVSAIVGTRVYAYGEVPQGTSVPYVTYQLVGSQAIGKTLAGEATYWRQQYQLDAWAPTGGSPSGTATAISLALAVRTALANQPLPGDDDIKQIDWDDWRDLPEPGWARREMDFIFWMRDP
jgi:Protein of unknown function (DUF3168)